MFTFRSRSCKARTLQHSNSGNELSDLNVRACKNAGEIPNFILRRGWSVTSMYQGGGRGELGIVHTYHCPTKGPRTSRREKLNHPPAVHEGTQERWH